MRGNAQGNGSSTMDAKMYGVGETLRSNNVSQTPHQHEVVCATITMWLLADLEKHCLKKWYKYMVAHECPHTS